jgi:hypothetical protein
VTRLTLHIDDLTLASRTDDSFDDLIARDQYNHGPLVKLNGLRRELSDDEPVTVEIAGKIPSNPAEERNLKMMFHKAGFQNLEYLPSAEGAKMRGVKRPLYRIKYDYGLHLQEIIGEPEILECHEFARQIYYFKDFNYDYDVSRQFDPNADVFTVKNSAGEVLAFGRLILRLPGYTCPFMHAKKVDGHHYEVPPRFVRVCEAMGLYVEGREGTVAFKKMMESLTLYAYVINQVDSIWTTYDDTDMYTGTYYRRKLLMENAGVKLVYRDFGGLWNLIFTDKIEELRNQYNKMFAR